MDRGAWEAEVHGVSMSRTRLSDFTFTFHFHAFMTLATFPVCRPPGIGVEGRMVRPEAHAPC